MFKNKNHLSIVISTIVLMGIFVLYMWSGSVQSIDYFSPSSKKILSVLYDNGLLKIELSSAVKNDIKWNDIKIDGKQIDPLKVEINNRIIKVTMKNDQTIPQKLFISKNSIFTENGYVDKGTYTIKNIGKTLKIAKKQIPTITYSIETPPKEFSYAKNAVMYGINSWNDINKNKLQFVESTKNPNIEIKWKYHKDSVIKLCDDCASSKTVEIGLYYFSCGDHYILYNNSTLAEAGAFGIGLLLDMGDDDFDLNIPVEFMPLYKKSYEEKISRLSISKERFDLAVEKLSFNAVNAGGNINMLLTGEWKYPSTIQNDVDEVNRTYEQYARLVDDINLLAMRMSKPSAMLNCPAFD